MYKIRETHLITGEVLSGIIRTSDGAIVPDDGLDGYQSALTNFRFLANDLWTTDEATQAMSAAKAAASK